MADAREHLIDTSGKLTLALSDLRETNDHVAALATGVGDLSLSDAAARVSQGARTAAAAASRVLKAAEAAEMAAAKAAAAVTAVEKAKADAAAAAETAAIATQEAAAAAQAVAALEVKIQPRAPVNHRYAFARAGVSGYYDDSAYSPCYPSTNALCTHVLPHLNLYRLLAPIPRTFESVFVPTCSRLCGVQFRSPPSGDGESNKEQGENISNSLFLTSG